MLGGFSLAAARQALAGSKELRQRCWQGGKLRECHQGGQNAAPV